MNLPKYNNCIVNLTSTILDYCGVPTKNKKIKLIENELKKGYKNVVLMVLDGFGTHAVKNLTGRDSILKSQLKQSYSSVFPATTTAATTSYITGLYPREHGWIGWSLYFKNENRCIDIFTNQDSCTGEMIEGEQIVRKYRPFNNIFKQIKEQGNGISTYSINPVYAKDVSENSYIYGTINEMFEKLEKVCAKKDKKFVYCYNEEPDHTMHEAGYSSMETKDVISQLEFQIKKFSSKMKNTLLIITADHGQIDVSNRHLLNNNKELCACLEVPPSIDSRAYTFFVKKGMERKFKRLFNKSYGKEFVLLSHKAAIKKLFGAKKDNNIDEFVGTYLAVGVKNSLLQYKGADGKEPSNFKGHHAGLTKQELEIPLILIGKN